MKVSATPNKRKSLPAQVVENSAKKLKKQKRLSEKVGGHLKNDPNVSLVTPFKKNQDSTPGKSAKKTKGHNLNNGNEQTPKQLSSKPSPVSVSKGSLNNPKTPQKPNLGNTPKKNASPIKQTPVNAAGNKRAGSAASGANKSAIKEQSVVMKSESVSESSSPRKKLKMFEGTKALTPGASGKSDKKVVKASPPVKTTGSPNVPKKQQRQEKKQKTATKDKLSKIDDKFGGKIKKRRSQFYTLKEKVVSGTNAKVAADIQLKIDTIQKRKVLTKTARRKIKLLTKLKHLAEGTSPADKALSKSAKKRKRKADKAKSMGDEFPRRRRTSQLQESRRRENIDEAVEEPEAGQDSARPNPPPGVQIEAEPMDSDDSEDSDSDDAEAEEGVEDVAGGDDDDDDDSGDSEEGGDEENEEEEEAGDVEDSDSNMEEVEEEEEQDAAEEQEAEEEEDDEEDEEGSDDDDESPPPPPSGRSKRDLYLSDEEDSEPGPPKKTAKDNRGGRTVTKSGQAGRSRVGSQKQVRDKEPQVNGKHKQVDDGQQDKQQTKKRYVLFVGNIPFNATKDDLFNHFKSVGEIASIRIPLESKTNKPRGFGYVEVTSEESYQKALSKHNSILNDRKIRVQYTEPGNKKSVEQKKKIKQKNFKLHAMRKEGKLKGSTKEGQKRSVRRKKGKGGRED